jgi:hypothetical protein
MKMDENLLMKIFFLQLVAGSDLKKQLWPDTPK